MFDFDEYTKEIDRLFGENRPKDAEQIMLTGLAEAREAHNAGFALQMLNELVGYYRSVSEKEHLREAIAEAVALAEELKEREKIANIAYATTLLNAATGHRSLGEYDLAEAKYAAVQSIYEKELAPGDMLYAGLYNNQSLLYQELGDYEKAYECQKKALAIVTDNNALFEIAVTDANLANTSVLLGRYDEAKEHAARSMAIFEKYNVADPHYCAAVSAVGMCLYHEGKYRSAYEMFKRGMDVVERSVGRNAQYERLKENADMCAEKLMTGMQLSKLYYETYGRKMIEEKFPEYADRIAVGLVGEGSDCFGFDDEQSADHDFGPDFCLWLADETYDAIGEALKAAYEELPKEFMGYTRTSTARGNGRRGVQRISDFYRRILGAADPESTDFRAMPDYALAAATNGEVFADPEGVFSGIREKLLKGYPEQILFLKLAEDAAGFSQTGQYNYPRMLKRGDRITADTMLSDCIRKTMILAHHMNRVYPPHDKWLLKSCENLPGGAKILAFVKRLHVSFAMEDAAALAHTAQVTEELGAYLAGQLYELDFISDTDSYLDAHTDELVRKASGAALSDKALVESIVKLEFSAFDKVKNTGGRASCQNDWPTFYVMRSSQYLTWNRTMLLQYLYDFSREFERGHNLITEKYGRMMESTAPAEYAAIEHRFEPLSDEKKRVIEQIVSVQMNMLESFAEEYPRLAGNARSFRTYEDNLFNTSYETYLRGELSTYSDKMLQLYGAYVVDIVRRGGNIARMTIENTGRLYGFEDLESFEKSADL